MGMFRTASGQPAQTTPTLSKALRAQVPSDLEATAEALAEGSGTVVEACWVVGRVLAEMGVPLAESLDRLRATTQLVRRRDPSYQEMHALSLAWSDTTLGFVHSMSCADPMTGLSTLGHLRHCLTDLYRDGFPPREHAMVVVEAPQPADRVSGARTMALLGESARAVFRGNEAIGQAGASRLVVVTDRNASLASRVSLLRRMVEPTAHRVWIEGLPHSDMSAGLLLDELARGH
ncbi:hypothetical protein BH09ACT11_BH09ACT11_00490 [soil metagenome]